MGTPVDREKRRRDLSVVRKPQDTIRKEFMAAFLISSAIPCASHLTIFKNVEISVGKKRRKKKGAVHFMRNKSATDIKW